MVHALAAVISVTLWTILMTANNFPLYIPVLAIVSIISSSGFVILGSHWATWGNAALSALIIALSVTAYNSINITDIEARQLVIAGSLSAALVAP